MRLRSLLTSIALGLVATGMASAQSEMDRAAARSTMADILAPWAADPDGPGAIIQVAVGGEPILVQAAGLAHLEHQIPISPQTRFQVASVSKQFTAYAIVQLAEAGQVDLDGSIADYIPEAQHYADVTLRDLMAHTHGIRGAMSLVGASGLRAQDVVTNAHALDLILRQRAMNFAPGERFTYNNSGFILLAEVVERVTGQSLDAYCRETIFAPLGMEATGFADRLHTVFPNRADSYVWTGEAYGHFAFNYALTGSTGLITTASDLALWAAHLDQMAETHPEVYERFHTLGVLNDGRVSTYAYGQEGRDFRGLETWSHGGRDAGFRAFLLRVPSHDLSITVLSNYAQFDVAGATYAVLEALMADQLAPVVADLSRPTADQLSGYAGDYAIWPGLIFSLRPSGETLEVSIPGQLEATRLPALSGHEFEFNPLTDLSFVFDPDIEGPAPGFDYRLGMLGQLRARRVELAPFDPAETTLDDYAGTYFSQELGVAYDIVVEEGQIVLSFPTLGSIALTAYQTDTFTSVSNYHQRIAFARDGEGQVQGFGLSGALMVDIAFERLR